MVCAFISEDGYAGLPQTVQLATCHLNTRSSLPLASRHASTYNSKHGSLRASRRSIGRRNGESLHRCTPSASAVVLRLPAL